MKVQRNVTRLKKLNAKDDSFAAAPPGELVGFIWELTKEIWSLTGRSYVKRRLQRNITKLIRQ